MIWPACEGLELLEEIGTCKDRTKWTWGDNPGFPQDWLEETTIAWAVPIFGPIFHRRQLVLSGSMCFSLEPCALAKAGISPSNTKTPKCHIASPSVSGFRERGGGGETGYEPETPNWPQWQLWTPARTALERVSLTGVLFGCFSRTIDGDS